MKLSYSQKALKYSLKVNGGKGGGNYHVGEKATITADPAPEGKTFDKWTSLDSISFEDGNSPTTSFIMPERSITVTAEWTYGASSGGYLSPLP